MQRKQIVKIVLWILIPVIVISGFWGFFHWNQFYNKNSLFKKFVVEDNKEVYILGTIGKKHFSKIRNYSMGNMISVIENVNPDLAMIQAREDHYERDGIVDGNIDACVAYSFCVENAINTSFIDWWIIDNIYPKYSTTNLRDDNIFIKISRNIKEAEPGAKLLVILDSENFYEQISRFYVAGWKEKDIENKSMYFVGKEEKFKFPAVVAKAWRDRTYFFAYNFPTEVKNLKDLNENIKRKFADADHDKFYLDEIQYCKYLNNDILYK